ncbi:hypothetical protein [Streptomyces sp. KL116D]|uniref:hypothetical protein n=1 Tax=Streptomyces sp. KL116D TaxID=3045152 RepID=UPI00355908E3
MTLIDRRGRQAGAALTDADGGPTRSLSRRAASYVLSRPRPPATRPARLGRHAPRREDRAVDVDLALEALAESVR